MILLLTLILFVGGVRGDNFRCSGNAESHKKINDLLQHEIEAMENLIVPTLLDQLGYSVYYHNCTNPYTFANLTFINNSHAHIEYANEPNVTEYEIIDINSKIDGVLDVWLGCLCEDCADGLNFICPSCSPNCTTNLTWTPDFGDSSDESSDDSRDESSDESNLGLILGLVGGALILVVAGVMYHRHINSQNSKSSLRSSDQINSLIF